MKLIYTIFIDDDEGSGTFVVKNFHSKKPAKIVRFGKRWVKVFKKILGHALREIEAEREVL